MKTKAAAEYAESVAAHKAIMARLKAAKIAVIEEANAKVQVIIDDLKSEYPQLQYATGNYADTSANDSRKRPKPETGALFFHLSVNPRWSKWDLTETQKLRETAAFHPHHETVVDEIIRRLELQGEWKLVEGSIFYYTDGPELGSWSDWVMIPV